MSRSNRPAPSVPSALPPTVAQAADPAALTVRLAKGRDKAVRQGHPWIFSGAVGKVSGDESSPVAEVQAVSGESLGVGLYNPRSQIRVRMLARHRGTVDRAFFAARLAEAKGLRTMVVGPETTGYRVLNAEGDGVPGWTVDRFGDVLVSQITAAGLETLRGEAYAALVEAFPDHSILQVNDLPTRRKEGLAMANEVIAPAPVDETGESEAQLPEEVLFTESGLTFTAEPGGQKTGFYCDQRDNRRRTESLAADRTVLDLFAHTGAFGLYALRGGATRVTQIESSPKTLERGRRHHELNAASLAAATCDPDLLARAEWTQADVFADLRHREDLYDLIVCDPPPLVRHRRDQDAGARAYKDLNRLALQRLAPGGFLLTFTCSAAVDTKLFRQILFAAAQDAGVSLSLLTPLSSGPDHPVSVYHPQGEYLKGWLCHRPG